ncbi:MAG: GNAT family N-acetyltransferase [Patescibacteria group bacterium]|nr:GNAT family N-acetyltransferase [Patescibacteria group bacterium]
MKNEKFNLKEINNIISNITFIRPGGNDTALVTGLNYSSMSRELINNTIIQKFPNIEQVGFIDLTNSSNPILEMAGGEFCGNATRSTAYLALNSQEGKVNITVSGVKKPLKAGVDNQGNAWAEMPVPNTIDITTTDQGWSIVPLEGITQVIVNKPDNLKTEEEVRAAGMKILKKLNLIDTVKASGVMFTSQEGDQILAEPVVWVKAMKTDFYETACGSGTAALGLYLANSFGKSQLTIPVIQPSGMIINASINLTKESPEVVISGPIEIISQNASIEINNQVTIQQLDNQEKLNLAFEKGFVSLYQDVFSEEPYFEYFSDQEVKSIFTDYLNQGGLIFTATENDQIVGFGAAIPIKKSSLVNVDGIKSLPDNTWYMAELGVKKSIRRQGLAKDLIQSRFKAMPKNSYVVMRTTKDNPASRSLYKKLGFQLLNLTQDVAQKRTGDQAEKDQRIFMGKQL